MASSAQSCGPLPAESIGKRIARLRAEKGWTQQALAARLAISRVAVSHIEMDLTLPSERTITLLAGILKCPPAELVANTTYPLAKAERLPEVTCCYTALEADLRLLENDLAWLKRLDSTPAWETLCAQVCENWRSRLAEWACERVDEREKELIADALQQLSRFRQLS